MVHVYWYWSLSARGLILSPRCTCTDTDSSVHVYWYWALSARALILSPRCTCTDTDPSVHVYWYWSLSARVLILKPRCKCTDTDPSMLVYWYWALSARVLILSHQCTCTDTEPSVRVYWYWAVGERVLILIPQCTCTDTEPSVHVYRYWSLSARVLKCATSQTALQLPQMMAVSTHCCTTPNTRYTVHKRHCGCAQQSNVTWNRRDNISRVVWERDGTSADVRFGFPAKRRSPFISAEVSVQLSTAFLAVRVEGERLYYR